MERTGLLFIHILFAMIWVGGILFVGWGLFPATKKFGFVMQRKILLAVMKWAHPFLIAAGLLVIVTGILLGVVFAPLTNWDIILESSYGRKWLTALGVGVFTLFWGTFVGFLQMKRLFQTDFYWIEAEKGKGMPLYKELFRLAILESVEVAGFLVLLYIMVRF